MEQTLKQKIIPEIDERQTRRESDKVSSYVEEALQDITPVDSDEGLFDMDELFDQLEDMQDMTDDMVGSDLFANTNLQDGFAGDMMFGEGTAEIAEPTQEASSGGLMEGMSDIVHGGAGKGGRRRPGDKIFDGLNKIGGKMDNQSGILSNMGKLFLTGAAAVAVGGFALSLLEGMFKGIKRFASASPLLGTAVDMIGFAIQMFLRPIARAIGTWLLPLAVGMVQLSTGFNRVWSEGGMFDAIRFLLDELANMVFTMDSTQMRNLAIGAGGLLMLRQFGAGAILSRLFPTQLAGQLLTRMGIQGLGSRILARMGLGGLAGRLAARLGGSLVPGLNAVLWGDLIFELIFGFSPIFDWLIPNTIDAFRLLVGWIRDIPSNVMDMAGGLSIPSMEDAATFLYDIWTTITDLRIMFFTLFGGFLLRFMDFFGWIQDGWDQLLSLFEPFSEALDGAGGVSGVIAQAFAGLLPDEDFGQVFAGLIPEFDIWGRLWSAWETLGGWPDAIFMFRVWDMISSLWSGWPNDVFDFGVWDMVEGAWDGWPSSIFTFGVWTTIENQFPGWPDLSWDGWDSFVPSVDWNLSGFSWGDFIPSIDWDLPDFPGWSDVVSGVSTAVGRVRERMGGGGGGASPSTGSTPGSVSGFLSSVRTSFGFASGGIATGPVSAVIGEGSESEVVAPLSRLDSMIQSRAGTDVDVTINDGVGDGMSQRELARAVESGVEAADVGDDNEGVEKMLRKVVREINRMRSDMDLEVDFSDQSKWEIRE